jgi:hypothetical protein
MLMLSKNLFRIPVISLRLGGAVATANEPIINPHNLKILGWWCATPGSKVELVLLAEDVREVMENGLAINDEDALCEPADLVRHKDILQIHFSLLDKAVKTKRQKLGKVSDFSYNEGLFVQKLYVDRSLIKVFASEDTLVIDRTQIVEVTDKYILVQDADVKAGAEEMAGAVAPLAS